MTCKTSILFLIAGALASTLATAKEIGQEKSLVGTWRLVSYADTPQGGKPIYAFGESPIGQFVFTKDGQISVQIMHNPPAPKNAPVDPDPDACMPSWFCAYFGTYTVSAKKDSWTAKVKGGNVVNYIGTDQKRNFIIKDGKLIISETYKTADGISITAERVLVRATVVNSR